MYVTNARLVWLAAIVGPAMIESKVSPHQIDVLLGRVDRSRGWWGPPTVAASVPEARRNIPSGRGTRPDLRGAPQPASRLKNDKAPPCGAFA
jgi:hypothetical protein